MADLSVLVMGMHRSGTSAVAAALYVAGISAGPEEELFSARPEQPLFYGERDDVGRFNDRLLAALGWTWDAPAPAPLPAAPELKAQVGEGRRLVHSILRRPAGFIKDPRISLLLPWWRRMLLDRFVAVVTVRQPEEVAWSLSVRDGLPSDLGLALWLTYHRHLAEGLDGLPVVVVDYDALTTDPAPTVAALLAELSRLGVAGDLDAEAAASAIVPVLRRLTQPSAANEGLVAEARTAAAGWLTGPVVAHERFSHAATAPTRWETTVLDLQRRVRRGEATTDAVRRASDESHASLEKARAEMAAADAARRLAEEARSAAQQQTEALRVETRAANEARDTALRELESLRGSRDEVLGERDMALADRPHLVWEREHASAIGASALRERDAALRERDGALRERDGALRERDSAFGARDSAISARDSAFAARDAALTERDVALTQRDAALAARDAALTERDDVRATLSAVEWVRDNAVHDRDEARLRVGELNQELDAMRAAREQALGERDRLRGEADRASRERDSLRLEAAEASAAFDRSQEALRQAEAQANGLLESLVGSDLTGAGGGWSWARRVWRRARMLLTLRWPRGLRQSPLFDRDWYLQQNPDVSEARISPWRHWRRHGWREGRDPNAWFDTAWYLAHNPDVAERGMDPLEHYSVNGWREGRDPSPRFASWWYLRQNADVATAGLDPLFHFMRHGIKEGRYPTPDAADPRGPSALALTPGPARRRVTPAGRRSTPAPGERTPSTAGAVGSQPGRPATEAPQAAAPRPEADAIRAARASLPGGAHVLVAAPRDADWMADVTTIGVVPVQPAEVAAGETTSAGARLVAELETRRQDGADHLLVPVSVAWWIERWPELRRYLAHFPPIQLADEVAGWRLDRPLHSHGMDGLVATVTSLEARQPAVLCWGMNGSFDAERLRGTRPFFATEPADRLPYLDHSIDLVALNGAQGAQLDEAIRVASLAVVRNANGRGKSPEVVWTAPVLERASRLSVVLHGDTDRWDPSITTRIRDVLPPMCSGELVVLAGQPASPVGEADDLTLRVLDTRPALSGVLDAASHDLVLFLDGSAWPVPGALEAMIVALSQEPRVPVIAGTVLGAAERSDGARDPVPLAFALVDRVRLAAEQGASADAGPAAGYAVAAPLVRRVTSAIAVVGSPRGTASIA
jgi:hypothetical protein